jgi:uncharacterized membrane protein YdjX (TVP38/TMEM64 family)
MTAPRIALAVALLAAAIVAVAIGWPLDAWLDGVAAWTATHVVGAGVLFVALYVVAAVLVVPCAILTLAAGFLFGVPLGVALTSLGSVLGAAAAFPTGRFVARDWILRRTAAWPRFRALDAATHHDGFVIVLLARLSPLIPYNLLNYALSVTSVRFRDYVSATWLGMLPITVVYVYVGSLANSLTALTSAGRAPSSATYFLLGIGFAATVALTLLITRRATRAFRERLAAEPQPSPSGGVE